MLRGEKVILRPVEREDLKQLHELNQNIDLVLLADFSWNPMPLATREKEFEKHIEDREHSWFIIEASGTMIGDIGLHSKRRRDGFSEFGIGIYDPAYLGKGYGREAVKLLLEWAFLTQNYRKIGLTTLASNERAVRSYRACGFVEEGRQREHIFFKGEYHDLLLMGLLRSEWQTRHQTEAV